MTNIYAINEGKLVYQVSNIELNKGTDYLSIELKLVAGWDYIGDSNTQGWAAADNFVEDVQYESIIQYFLKEGLIECLEGNGYTVVENYKDYTK